MKQKLLFFIKYALLWTAFFILSRGLFLISQFDKSALLSFKDILNIFFHGFRMDLAAVGYLLLIPGLLMCTTTLIPIRIFNFTIHGYTFIMAAFVSIITVVDFELFKHWGFRFDATPLKYLGKETTASSELSTILFLSGCFIVILFATLFAYFYLTKKHYSNMQKGHWVQSPIFFILTAALIIPIRGSFGVSPMNLGTVFFHKKNPFANQAAINLFWNFGDSVTKILENKGYPENFHDKQETEKTIKKLYSDTNKSKSIIKNNPNVILIILESFSAKIVETMGGKVGVTPNLNSLSKEGILFQNIYSSGSRTDKGLISILSAYPAQPKTSIVTYSNKSDKLPKLNHAFLDKGYKTSFIYGGNSNYANINSYLNMSMYDTIITKDDFDPELITSKWGVHDHILLDSSINYLLKLQEPFYSTILTLSSHEPFEVPYKSEFLTDSEEDMYLNSANYTDDAVGKFITKLKSSPKWENTLVVITADHGTRHPNNSLMHEKERYHIPMLWAGGALQVNDTTITKYGSQTDIMATLYDQLGIEDPNLKYSKNLLSYDSKSFATYYFNNGFGFVDDSTEIVFNLDSNSITTLKGDSSKLAIAKAYMQSIYSDFNSK